MRLLFSFFLFLFSFFSLSAQEIFQHERLVNVWSSDSTLNVPESVFHDADENLLYVANINGRPTDKDGNGFLSRLDMDGNIIELEWITGLHAPKGMGKTGNKLYVTDIDRVAEIDLEKAEIIKYYPSEGAKFLNDISVDKNGNVYISDMQTNKIHRISDGKLEVWLESDQLKTPNGLFVHGDALLIGISGSVLKVNLKDKKITTYIDDTGGIDGLEEVGKGYFIISDWAGNVHLIHPEKDKLKVLDTTPAKINAADIEFIVDKQMLLVPTFFDNRVVAYKLKP